MAPKPKYKQLQAPTHRQLYTDPITEPTTNKKIQTDNKAFIFFICNTRPNIIFLVYKNNITRINTILKPYTQEDYTQQQLVKLLQEPQLIQDKQTSFFIIETIFITCKLLNIDITHFINFHKFKQSCKL